MILYHGSNVQIDIIDIQQSKPNKDFGKGFYLSEQESQAIEMANFKSILLLLISFVRPFIISDDLSDEGNILPPLSFLSFIP